MGSNGHGGSLHHGDTDLGKAGLILRQKLGQDRTNGLRPLTTTIFPLTVFLLELADAVFHGCARKLR